MFYLAAYIIFLSVLTVINTRFLMKSFGLFSKSSRPATNSIYLEPGEGGCVVIKGSDGNDIMIIDSRSVVIFPGSKSGTTFVKE